MGARHRRDQHHLAESLLAGGGFRLGKQADRLGRRAQDTERRDDMDVEHLLELVVAHLLDDAVERVARVADDDVEPVEGLDRGVDEAESGRASWRERVCKYVYVSVGAVSLNKKKINK